jgi:hypothetical protein
MIIVVAKSAVDEQEINKHEDNCMQKQPAGPPRDAGRDPPGTAQVGLFGTQ